MSAEARSRVLVAGGGVAGLEAMLALHDLAGDRVELALVDPAPEFRFRPMAVAEPFARGHMLHIPFERVGGDVAATYFADRLTRVDTAHKRALVENSDPLAYDVLLIAVGASSVPAYDQVLTWTPEADSAIFGGLLRDLEDGYSKSVAFIVPPDVAWALPAYELALMTAWEARSMGQDDVTVTVVTHENAPLEAFGTAGSDAVRADLLDAGVTVETNANVVERAGPAERFVMQPGGRPLEADRIVSLPRAHGPRLGGVPSDERGFIPVDRNGRIAGTDSVWVAGDATSFPIKQGGIAAQQADAAAESIAAELGADVDPQPFKPVLRGVLLTGRRRQWLRSELTGDDGEPEAAAHSLWWPPTKVAGRYLSPYLQAFFDAEAADVAPEPTGHAVELDLGSDFPTPASAG